MMKRIYKLTGGLAVAIAIWVALLESDLEPNHHTVVLLAPALVVLAFGAYSAVALAYGVLTFKSWPEEEQLLRKEIEVARKDLAKRGVVTHHEKE